MNCNHFFKWLSLLGKCRKQRPFIEFLFWEGESVANIHHRLKNTPDVSILSGWVSQDTVHPRVKEETDLNDKPCSGRSAAAMS